ncbi:MAG: hypothetical protein CMF74_02440 [Maricaulis sp.]|jgi:hypothetical protein|nr:hypothetical protein [Maricaulis sp.]HAQ35192.1 DUF2948 domain-containing protein [Alphaproteobacteria bacterium]|tara:strand:- start:473 stop:940 length:468 start_codon:yes stop_codon:yes gene_type:complete
MIETGTRVPRQRKPLRLIAAEPDDVPIVSAALQDAVAQLRDVQWDRRARRFTIAANRFRWEDGKSGPGWRVRAALDIGSVLSVKSSKVKQDAPGAVVSILAIVFETGDAPGGAIRIELSGGGSIRVAVECVDLLLADVSEPWRASGRPDHGGSDA